MSDSLKFPLSKIFCLCKYITSRCRNFTFSSLPLQRSVMDGHCSFFFFFFSRRPLSPGIANASGDSVLRQDPHFLFLTVPFSGSYWAVWSLEQGWRGSRADKSGGHCRVRRARWGWHRRARVSPGLPTRPHPWPLSTPYCDSRGGGHTKIPHAVSTVSSPHVQTTPSSAPHWSSDWLHVPLKGRNL